MLSLVRVALLLAPALFVPALIEPFEAPKAAVVRIAGIAILAWAAAWPGRLRGLGRTPLDVAVGAWLAVEVAATLASRAPWLSLFGEQRQHEGLLTSLGLAGLYLGARLAVRGPAGAIGVVDAWLSGTAVAAGYALLQAAGLDPAPWRDTAVLAGTLRPFGTLGHPNLLGLVTAAAAVVALTRAALGIGPRWLLLGAAGLFGAATLVTLSRAAWLGLIAGIATGAWLAARSRRFRPAIGGARAAWIGAAAMAALALVVAFSGWGAIVAARVVETVGGGESGASRLEIWRIALAAWRDRPLLGQGPDTLGLMFTHFQTPAMWALEWGRVADHAHSIYLHALATRGALGALAGAAAATALLSALRSAWRRDEARPVAGVMAAALATLAVAGGFGALGVTGAAIVASSAGAIAALAGPPVARETPATAPDRTSPAARPRRRGRAASGRGAARGPRASAPAAGGARVAAVVAALATLAWSVNELAAAHEVDRALRGITWRRGVAEPAAQLEAALMADRVARVAGRVPFDDWAPRTLSETLYGWALAWPEPMPLLARAESAAREAIRRVPLRSLDHLRLAEVLASRAIGGDPAARDPAEAAFRRASELAPQDAHVWVEWARTRLALGDPAGARALARHVAALYPVSGIAQQVLAESELAAGDSTAARAALARAAAGRWYGDAGGMQRAADLARRLGAQP